MILLNLLRWKSLNKAETINGRAVQTSMMAVFNQEKSDAVPSNNNNVEKKLPINNKGILYNMILELRRFQCLWKPRYILLLCQCFPDRHSSQSSLIGFGQKQAENFPSSYVVCCSVGLSPTDEFLLFFLYFEI